MQYASLFLSLVYAGVRVTQVNLQQKYVGTCCLLLSTDKNDNKLCVFLLKKKRTHCTHLVNNASIFHKPTYWQHCAALIHDIQEVVCPFLQRSIIKGLWRLDMKSLHVMFVPAAGCSFFLPAFIVCIWKNINKQKQTNKQKGKKKSQKLSFKLRAFYLLLFSHAERNIAGY